MQGAFGQGKSGKDWNTIFVYGGSAGGISVGSTCARAFEGARYKTSGMYRPRDVGCFMKALGYEFSAYSSSATAGGECCCQPSTPSSLVGNLSHRELCGQTGRASCQPIFCDPCYTESVEHDL